MRLLRPLEIGMRLIEPYNATGTGLPDRGARFLLDAIFPAIKHQIVANTSARVSYTLTRTPGHPISQLHKSSSSIASPTRPALLFRMILFRYTNDFFFFLLLPPPPPPSVNRSLHIIRVDLRISLEPRQTDCSCAVYKLLFDSICTCIRTCIRGGFVFFFFF